MNGITFETLKEFDYEAFDAMDNVVYHLKEAISELKFAGYDPEELEAIHDFYKEKFHEMEVERDMIEAIEDEAALNLLNREWAESR